MISASLGEACLPRRAAKWLDCTLPCCQVTWGSTLFHPEDLPFRPSAAPLHYGDFRDRVSGRGRGRGAPVRHPLPVPESLKGLPAGRCACVRAHALGARSGLPEEPPGRQSQPAARSTVAVEGRVQQTACNNASPCPAAVRVAPSMRERSPHLRGWASALLRCAAPAPTQHWRSWVASALPWTTCRPSLASWHLAKARARRPQSASGQRSLLAFPLTSPLAVSRRALCGTSCPAGRAAQRARARPHRPLRQAQGRRAWACRSATARRGCCSS